MGMKNALEFFRVTHEMTFRKLAEACEELSLYAVYRHCRGQKISGESAIIYSKKLGIPLSSLRPDLWPPATPNTPTEPEEVSRAE